MKNLNIFDQEHYNKLLVEMENNFVYMVSSAECNEDGQPDDSDLYNYRQSYLACWCYLFNLLHDNYEILFGWGEACSDYQLIIGEFKKLSKEPTYYSVDVPEYDD